MLRRPKLWRKPSREQKALSWATLKSSRYANSQSYDHRLLQYVLCCAPRFVKLPSTFCVQGDEYKAFESAARSFFDADVFDTTSKDVAKLLKLSKPGTVGVARKYFDEWEFVSSEGHEAFKDVPEEADSEEDEEEGAPKKEKKDTSPAGKMAAFFKQEMAKVYTPYDSESQSKLFEGPIQHYVRHCYAELLLHSHCGGDSSPKSSAAAPPPPRCLSSATRRTSAPLRRAPSSPSPSRTAARPSSRRSTLTTQPSVASSTTLWALTSQRP